MSPDGSRGGDGAARLRPVREMAERHLTVLDEGADAFTFATFTDAKSKPRPDPLARILHGGLGEHWRTLCDLNARGAGVYVVVNATDGVGAKNENIVRIRALWQEADRGDEPALPVEPHIIIESSPGKHHRYVLVDGCPIDGDAFERVQQRLVDDYGSDPNAKDRRRVLRLAGFYHRKDPAHPHLVRIVHESGEPPLPWARVVAIFPPVERAQSKPVEPGDVGTTGPGLVRIAEVASALLALDPDLPYGAWLRVGMALHSSGASREALTIWDQWSARGRLYRKGECGYRWGTFGRSKARSVTLGTLFRLATEAGWDGEIALDPDALPLVDKQRVRMLLEFGRRHAVCMVQGKCAVVYRELDANGKRWTTHFSSQGDMAMHHANERVPFVDQVRGMPVITRKPLVPIWMQSPLRRTYDQVAFRPIAGLVARPGELPEGPVLNLYQGLALEPRPGDCQLILDHVLDVWCSGSTELYAYVMGWLARMFQRPDERGHTVIVLKSGEGTGKDIIVAVLVKAFGEHAFVAVKAEDLLGRFNDHLATSTLVYLNEALWGGDKAQEGALKSLVTDEALPVERKYLPKYRVTNCTHLIVASNSDWAVPVGMDDRRYVVLDVSEDRKGDFAYFERLAQCIENGGAEAFIHHLLNRDLSRFNPRHLPDAGRVQVSKFDMKMRGADPVTQWWHERLAAGEIHLCDGVAIGGEWEGGPVDVPVPALFGAFVTWCQVRRHRVIPTDASFGSKLRQLVHAQVGRPRVPGRDGKRPRVYRLPALADCRQEFETWVRQRVDWQEADLPPAGASGPGCLDRDPPRSLPSY